MKNGEKTVRARGQQVRERTSLARRAVVGLSLALATLPTLLSAQIVSNLAEATSDQWFVQQGLWRGGKFVTGSNAGGYTLDSITADFIAVHANPTGFETRIYSESSNEPDTLLETISTPDPRTAGNHTFESTGLALTANTTYFLIFAGGDNGGFYRIDRTNSDNETSSDGWTIGNDLTSSFDQGSTWSVDHDAIALQFSVQATPVPEPHEYALLVGLGLVGFVGVRRRMQQGVLSV